MPKPLLDTFKPREGKALLQEYLESLSARKCTQLNPAFDASHWGGASPALDRWHDFIERSLGKSLTEGEQQNLMKDMASLISDDIIFSPPTYWQSRPGKMTTLWILKQISEIFSHFTYQRQIIDESRTNVLLEFSCMVDEIPCQGVDIILFDGNHPDAKIVDFKVMIRPPEAAIRIKQHMRERARSASHLFKSKKKRSSL